MIAPAWLKNATQPIAIDDTLSYLNEALTVEASAGREIQIGGPDVLSYGEMLDRMAEVLEHPPPAADPGAADHPVALLALDRARHTCRRRGGKTIDRRTRRANGRHRPLRNDSVRHRANQLRPSTRTRRRGRPRACAPMRALERLFISRPRPHRGSSSCGSFSVDSAVRSRSRSSMHIRTKSPRSSLPKRNQGKSLGDAVLGKIKDAWTRAVLRPTS